MRDVTNKLIAVIGLPDVSTHTPHAGRDANRAYFVTLFAVSTHTPHAGRDKHMQLKDIEKASFYSHAPCGT